MLPRQGVDTNDHAITFNPAECLHREALIAWLNATAPIYWYDGTVVPVERRHIAKGRPGRSCSCALALTLHDATGEQWEVGRSRCHAYPVAARTWYVPYALSRASRHFIKRFDQEPHALIESATFVLRMSGCSTVSRGPHPTLDLYTPAGLYGHA